MSFKDIAKKVFYAPANAFSGIANAVLGHTQITTHNEFGRQYSRPKMENKPGLIGLLAEGIKTVSRSAANFLANHKQAIATAFWASLAVAGAAALTLFLWPAALTAVATFSVYGLSIAAVAGANALAQIGLAAGLAAAATSAVIYTGAAVGNFVSWIADCCKGLKSKMASSIPASKAPTKTQTDAEPELKGGNPYASSKLQTTDAPQVLQFPHTATAPTNYSSPVPRQPVTQTFVPTTDAPQQDAPQEFKFGNN
ncbi:hypothetical protein OQJ15_13190 [Fluoribacter dumoffii]|uniref:Transmembrane protein n=1 Tax=Fluoribacter dumoffii TaxID=463 RepID=A0A377G5J4_9GAMM|nr:hypothetical protein [Fluoribacter dumoffii]KTC91619.1 transmembrane protein [Fluoribacter dumoffii NY 23]MCW8387257.1 hypothetical protein [Fluoribacter dumoffii]MCW8497461.1 hypothetical protein [Fluoribacter dumoffii]STO20085.1 Uncharacterised protein [Fluoribacter dumoffii]